MYPRNTGAAKVRHSPSSGHHAQTITVLDYHFYLLLPVGVLSKKKRENYAKKIFTNYPQQGFCENCLGNQRKGRETKRGQIEGRERETERGQIEGRERMETRRR